MNKVYLQDEVNNVGSIFQLIEFFDKGTGVGGIADNIRLWLNIMGYDNCIYTFKCEDEDDSFVRIIDNIDDIVVGDNDILIYHYFMGSPLTHLIKRIRAHKIVFFHNVTFPHFFSEYDSNIELSCIKGLFGIEGTSNTFNRAIVLSDFSKNVLIEKGWISEKIDVIPQLSNRKFCEPVSPDNVVLKKYNDNYTNILYVGRISPHKKVEDVIECFRHYQKRNGLCRLILVGEIQIPTYFAYLKKYIVDNRIENVYFTNRVSESELEAYYRISDIFLFMSEHEGFGMPLLEAMQHGLPVLAYSCTAVTEVVENAGVLFDRKEPDKVADVICSLCEWKLLNRSEDKENYNNIVEAQYKKVENIFGKSIEKELQKVFDRTMESTCMYATNDNLIDIKACGKKSINDIGQFAIFGVGQIGRKLIDTCLDDMGMDNIVCVDSNNMNHSYRGLDIVNIEFCNKKYPDISYVITSKKFWIEIFGMLSHQGVKLDKIFFWDDSTKTLI